MIVYIYLLRIWPKNFVKDKCLFVSSIQIGEVLFYINFSPVRKAVNNRRRASFNLRLVSWPIKKILQKHCKMVIVSKEDLVH